MSSVNSATPPIENQSIASSTMLSASRQKACSACIKAKRKCDRQHPACKRCTSKQLDWQYESTRLHGLSVLTDPGELPADLWLAWIDTNRPIETREREIRGKLPGIG